MANLQNELAQVQHISGELHTNAHAKIGMVVGRFNSYRLLEIMTDFQQLLLQLSERTFFNSIFSDRKLNL